MRRRVWPAVAIAVALVGCGGQVDAGEACDHFRYGNIEGWERMHDAASDLANADNPAIADVGQDLLDQVNSIESKRITPVDRLDMSESFGEAFKACNREYSGSA